MSTDDESTSGHPGRVEGTSRTNAQRQKDYRRRKAEAEGRKLGTVGRPAHDHGSEARYAAGCSCDECKAAHTRKMAEYRASGRERRRDPDDE